MSIKGRLAEAWQRSATVRERAIFFLSAWGLLALAPIEATPILSKGPIVVLIACCIALIVILDIRWVFSQTPSAYSEIVLSFLWTLSMVLVLFALLYWAISSRGAGAFNEPLTKIDALYFVVTTFSTIGFGDILPVSEEARFLVAFQLLVGLTILLVLLVGVLSRSDRKGTTSGSS